MTRYLAVWHPGFESGMSRTETVRSFSVAWTLEMKARRRVYLSATADARAHEECARFLRETWKTEMRPRPRLSLILVEDPLWKGDEALWRRSVEAVKAGYAAASALDENDQRPQFHVFALETDEAPGREV